MRTIDVYVYKKEYLLETYDEKSVSNDLIEYIINKTFYCKKNEQVSIVLHVTEDTKGCTSLIQKGLEDEYYKNIQNHNIVNFKQIILLLMGICMLFISTLYDDSKIINEIILIGGWVPIWEAVELELLTDTSGRKRHKQLKKLLHCNIEEVIDER